ncbi:hypothetical protein CR513_31724, partial [Mucuna pruriens]
MERLNYYYQVMPFGLKNTVIRWNLEVYLDNMYNIRLNLDKCAFKVQGRKVLGFIICEEAFQAFKRFLTLPPLLAIPIEEHNLCLYLVVFEHAINVVVVQGRGRTKTLCTTLRSPHPPGLVKTLARWGDDRMVNKVVRVLPEVRAERHDQIPSPSRLHSQDGFNA